MLKKLDVHLLKTDILNDCTTHYLQFGLHALERGSSRKFFSHVIFWDLLTWINLLAGAFDGLEKLALIQLLLGSELNV